MGKGWRRAIQDWDRRQRKASRSIEARSNAPDYVLNQAPTPMVYSIDDLEGRDLYAHLDPPRDPPIPTLIITGCQAWDANRHRPCPACNDAPMKPNHYCARCDRWGRDGPPGQRARYPRRRGHRRR